MKEVVWWSFARKKGWIWENIIGDLSNRLTAEYGKGFEKSSVFKMVKFYQEFPEYEKVATLSQQLTWSHLVELLPIEDELKRDFYTVMCKNENWSVRTLRERKNQCYMNGLLYLNYLRKR